MLFAKKPKYDYIIVGLGNPGDKYKETRHNAGFRALDILAADLNAGSERNKHQSILREAEIKDKKILLCWPQTFMNNSGAAVSEILRFYKLEPTTVIVISDDVSMDAGRLRIRASGSHGGHNGLKDIIELCGTDLIPRVKIGVGSKPHPDYDLADWVLGKPDKESKEKIDEAETAAAKAVKLMITGSINDAMSKFNR